jgi:hypothetical protein
MKIIGNHGYEYETDGMTIGEVTTLLRDLQDIADSIEMQIEKAKARRIETGEYAPAAWMVKANSALRHKRRSEERVRELLGAMKKGERVLSRAWSEYFVDICKENMEPEKFSAISAEAEERRLAANLVAQKEVKELA